MGKIFKMEVPEWLGKSINKGLLGKRLPVNKAMRAINEINRQIALHMKKTQPPAPAPGVQPGSLAENTPENQPPKSPDSASTKSAAASPAASVTGKKKRRK